MEPNILLQKIFNVSIPNSTDLIAYLLIPMVYFTFPAIVLSDKGPLSADVLSKVMPKAVKSIIAVFSFLLQIAICGYIATIPFIITYVIAIYAIYFFPQMVTWLPGLLT